MRRRGHPAPAWRRAKEVPVTMFGVVILAVWLCSPALFALPGCRAARKEKQTLKPAGAVLRIGIASRRSIIHQFERYEPLARYLSSRIGTEVKLTILPKYESTLNSFLSQKVDAAFFGSFPYVLAHARMGVEVLVRPVGLDGVSTRHGLIFVRTDSGIRSVRDMRGKRFAFIDRETTAGYLLPLAYLKKAGVSYRTYLGESYYTASSDDAISDVLNRKADIGTADDAEFEGFAARDERARKELLILARSPDVPENSLAVREGLDESLKQRLKAALLDMHEDDEGAAVLLGLGLQRFEETTDSDFKAVYEYTRALGLNLRVWDGRYLP